MSKELRYVDQTLTVWTAITFRGRDHGDYEDFTHTLYVPGALDRQTGLEGYVEETEVRATLRKALEFGGVWDGDRELPEYSIDRVHNISISHVLRVGGMNYALLDFPLCVDKSGHLNIS